MLELAEVQRGLERREIELGSSSIALALRSAVFFSLCNGFDALS